MCINLSTIVLFLKPFFLVFKNAKNLALFTGCTITTLAHILSGSVLETILLGTGVGHDRPGRAVQAIITYTHMLTIPVLVFIRIR